MKIFLILLKNCENLIAFLAFWETILHKPLMMSKFPYFVLSSRLLGLQKIEKLQVYYPFCFFIRLQTQVHLRKCSIFKNQPGDRKIFYIRDRIFFKLIIQLNFNLSNLIRGIVALETIKFFFLKNNSVRKKN